MVTGTNLTDSNNLSVLLNESLPDAPQDDNQTLSESNTTIPEENVTVTEENQTFPEDNVNFR